MSEKKLFRCMKNKQIAGVCAGIADFFSLDITIVRLTWILISCFSGGVIGIILYILCVIIIPVNNEENQS